MHSLLRFLGIMILVFIIIYFFVDSDLFISEPKEFLVSGLVITGGALCGLLIKHLLKKKAGY